MLNPSPPAAPAPAPELEPASPASESFDPERATELKRQLNGIALALLDSVMREPGDSTAGRPTTAKEKMLARVLRSALPSLRDALLARLSEADPAGLERLIGASASALESILYYAPGEPQPRFRFDWQQGPDGWSVDLVPVDLRRDELAPSQG